MKRQIRDRTGKSSKIVKISAYRKHSLAILKQIREYEDRYEYQFIPEYENEFHDFQADSIQLGDVFPQLFDLGDRVILVSIDFFKNRFCLDAAIKWLEKNNVALGSKSTAEVIIDDAHEMIAGMKFNGYPLVAYSRGNKRIRITTTELVEITEKFICERFKVDTTESKDVQFGLTIVYNDEISDGIPRIDLDMSRDLVICNGAVVVADYIDEYHGCLAFFREDGKIPVSFVLDTNTTIYIDSYDRDDTGAMTYTIKYQYIIDLESLNNKIPVEEAPTPKVHKVVRTVPYYPKGREGVLIGDDGSFIYDDSWLHQDILDAERNDGGDKK